MVSPPTFDSFTKWVDIHENVDITKNVDVRTHVFGNLGLANATADAYGPNTASETITETHAMAGVWIKRRFRINVCDERCSLLNRVNGGRPKFVSSVCRVLSVKFGFPVTYPTVHGPGARTAMRRVTLNRDAAVADARSGQFGDTEICAVL